MLLGLDVGGTHTDAVLIDGNSVVASYKAVTDHNNLLKSINKALKEVTGNIDKNEIKIVNLSTTLSTNAIVENRIEDVGVIISSGPGIDPENYRIGNNNYIIEGSINHRGTEIKKLDERSINMAIEDCFNKKIRVFAAVTKFSTRNPDQENIIGSHLSDSSDFITLGHQLSGELSFPRRIVTAYYNSAVWRIFNNFINAIEESINKLGIEAKINILKADGGTIPLAFSRKIPVETILSGPAASVMGIIALCKISEDSIILDIGGTTTDIAIFISGSPLIEKEGISLNSSPTLVRALKTKSIGIGGDSCIKINGKSVTVGPERKGPSMADGGEYPSLVDALNYSGIIEYADKAKSINGLSEQANAGKISPDFVADAAVEYAVEKIKTEVDDMIQEINEKPVYTVHEMIEGKKIIPNKIYMMGGPAKGFIEMVSKKFKMNIEVPKNYQVANAIGAALTKTTFDIELFADTSKGVLLIPNLNIHDSVSGNYMLEDAENDARRYLLDYLLESGIKMNDSDVEIVESSSFNIVSGYFSSGKDIRVKCQIKPGVTMNIK